MVHDLLLLLYVHDLDSEVILQEHCILRTSSERIIRSNLCIVVTGINKPREESQKVQE